MTGSEALTFLTWNGPLPDKWKEILQDHKRDVITLYDGARIIGLAYEDLNNGKTETISARGVKNKEIIKALKEISYKA